MQTCILTGTRPCLFYFAGANDGGSWEGGLSDYRDYFRRPGSSLGCSIPYLSRLVEKRSARRWSRSSPQKQKEDKEKKQRRDGLQWLWEIEDVRNGVLQLTNNRYRAILRITPINVALMSEEEQTATEDALMACAMGISFPVQFVSATNTVDTRHAVSGIAARATRDPSPIRQAYAEQLCQYLDAIQDTKGVLSREIYVVVTSDQRDPGKAAQELDHRCAVLANSLGRANVVVERLSSEAIVDLLHHQLNRGKRVRPSEVVAAGGLDLCLTGKKGVPLGVR
ncbi:MAG: hypothetical protein H0Z39_07125 [Peptococcaceae bacterium]|nr:hypothetical protein [Peptococcaceae bacterium]